MRAASYSLVKSYRRQRIENAAKPASSGDATLSGLPFDRSLAHTRHANSRATFFFFRLWLTERDPTVPKVFHGSMDVD